MNRKLAIALVAAAVMPVSLAQQLRGPGSFATARGPMGRPQRQGPGPLYLYSAFPYTGYSGETMVEAPPQVIVVQIPSAAEPAPLEKRPEPLLIEWQGDRYVRVGGADEKTENGSRVAPDYATPAAAKPAVRQAEVSAPVLLPIVLVYRDGRHEEIRDYIIADGVIYARGDYWTDGYWNKKIQLAALNLPATMKASQERGAKFVLPGSANEVIVRP